MTGEHKTRRLRSNQFDRTVVLGNTASGKSWLSQRLGEKLSSAVVELDRIRWVDGDFSRKASVQVAIAKTLEKAEQRRWIMEGVYGWLITPIINRATCVVWTDIPWSESHKNLIARETARGPAGNLEELETWSKDYWTRMSASSFAAHLDIFNSFAGPKFRLINKSEISSFVDRVAET
ncbi:hypothetical protein [uncultured Ruegeria sp.]|uniref:hypothetical protein n=1 Tax=uncultured Ruegeria sp. TaxID=259304 RepID=UPI00263642B9|nr:hypothetical protein [uncultured Ruegeria sp.]